MAVIENFSIMSEADLEQFVNSFVADINSKNIFLSGIGFIATDWWADELSGNLLIDLSTQSPISVERKATWQSANPETVDELEDNVEYAASINDDARKSFKTTVSELNGYRMTLSVNDVDELDTTDVNVDTYTEEDSGVGSYEFWGAKGYDSHPYCEVEGTVTVSCDCYLTLEVEPI